MTFSSDLEQEPWLFDFYTVMRHAERSHPDRPRIGDSASRREEFILLGEDPYMDFAASTLSRAERDAEGRLKVFVKFLGLLGPQGPLPLATTNEAYEWWLARDDSFPRFLDLLNHRFLQLFFRAWGDSRPAVQHDRPEADRFLTYVGSAVGLGSEPYRGLDSVADSSKTALAGLMAPKAKSAPRLKSAVAGVFGVTVDIEEFIGTYLPFDVADRTRLGQAHASLGVDLLVGSSVYSVEDKFRVKIVAESLAEFESFLPSGEMCEPLADLVFFYIGEELDWDLELALPAAAVRPVSLGQFGRLGYTTWMQSQGSGPIAGYRRDARFHPAERVAERRRAAETTSNRG